MDSASSRWALRSALSFSLLLTAAACDFTRNAVRVDGGEGEEVWRRMGGSRVSDSFLSLFDYITRKDASASTSVPKKRKKKFLKRRPQRMNFDRINFCVCVSVCTSKVSLCVCV